MDAIKKAAPVTEPQSITPGSHHTKIKRTCKHILFCAGLWGASPHFITWAINKLGLRDE